ncbi:MAG: hypothetical protein FJ139_01415 [Deltaproteobacteria bacterium]|nr:hypothetical protein [Deltaproteobacteria bacterium]
MERDKLIEKLKTVKDPRERDRIIWALSGQEKSASDEVPAPSTARPSAPSPETEKGEKLPQLPSGIRRIFAYVVPIFFIFFGLINIIQAAMHFLAGEPEAAVPQLIMGGMFLLFGIISFVKAKKQAK